MRASILILAGVLIMLNGSYAVAAAEHPIVLELFTSQGCSSCPPADALVKQLSSSDPSLLPLSFHVHYWDYLGWKDPFSSAANSDRQRAYAQSAGGGQVFTPQLIVNGGISTIGSNEGEVRKAIAEAKQMPSAVDVSIMPDPTSGQLKVVLTTKDQASLRGDVDIWGVSFSRHSTTKVNAGENGGRMLESINNVTEIKRLGVWRQAGANSTLQVDPLSDDGFAVIVQAQQQGRILGAASYIKRSAVY